MLDELTPRQWQEWQAFMYIEPQGRQTELLATVLCAYLNRNSSGHGKGVTLQDILGDVYRITRKLNADEMLLKLDSIFGTF